MVILHFPVRLSLIKWNTMVRSRKVGTKDSKHKVRKEDNDLSRTEEISAYHAFSEPQILQLRESLLKWYDSHKRDLPWRKIVSKDLNQRAYAVWVSEVMLQQTQVATVISYYNNWMKKWPTLQDLASANVEQVNEVWTGLGYYSRARRLLEGVQKVVTDMRGEMPATATALQQNLPGVGRYTASAIASIVFDQVVGVVDGNVVRVVARLRGIGASSTQPSTQDTIWSLANQVVDPKRPGDFNQALMELGATVCTPKNPSCAQCPVRHLCHAFAMVERDKERSAKKLCAKTNVKVKDVKPNIIDIECLVPSCQLCLPADQPWDRELGVANFPRKPKKAEAKKESINVLIGKMEEKGNPSGSSFLICQRPNKGLLAGMWEFPTCDDLSSQEKLIQAFSENTGLDVEVIRGITEVGEVSHQFSHVHHLYKVWALTLAPSQANQHALSTQRPMKWVTQDQMEESAVSVGMQKVFKLYKNSSDTSKVKLSRKRGPDKDVIIQEPKRTQATLSLFFKRT